MQFKQLWLVSRWIVSRWLGKERRKNTGNGISKANKVRRNTMLDVRAECKCGGAQCAFKSDKKHILTITLLLDMVNLICRYIE